MSDEIKTAAALVIGDEILSGRTQDANAHHLAQQLGDHGVRMVEIRVIEDAHDTIVSAVRALKEKVDYLFTSGGIGPTHDDITADAVAEACGDRISIRADARAILADYYGEDDLNEARLRMARIPSRASLIDNPISRAPGFKLENVYVMAGVPIIFREMLATVLSTLEGGAPMLSRSVRAAIPEGDIAAGVADLASKHPTVSIGVYPFFKGGLGCTIVMRGVDDQALDRVEADVKRIVAALVK